LRNFVAGLKVIDPVLRPLLIYCDNTAVAFAIKDNSESRSRHNDIKFLRVKDGDGDQLVTFKQIRTESMITDSLTKALPVAPFKGQVKHIKLVKD